MYYYLILIFNIISAHSLIHSFKHVSPLQTIFLFSFASMPNKRALRLRFCSTSLVPGDLLFVCELI